MHKFVFLLSLVALLSNQLSAQKQDSLKVVFSGYFDFYYAFDFNKPEGLTRQPFLVSYNRSRLMGLNLASAGVEICQNRWRTKATLQAGSFVTDNYETVTDKKLGFIQEAYAGIAINSGKSVWLDIGVFPSHIGYETAIAADNFAASRSLASELTPYFVSGAKITFKYTKVQVTGLLLNGWNRIFGYKAKQYPSLGTQVSFSPRKNSTFYWNSMLGSSSQNAFNALRFYNNFFVNWNVNAKNQFILSYDLGLQQSAGAPSGYKNWSTASVVYRRQLASNFFLSCRGEYFRDKSEAVTRWSNGNFFNLLGYSANLDYRFSEDALIRLEGRVFHSGKPYFQSDGGYEKNYSVLMICFSKKF